MTQMVNRLHEKGAILQPGESAKDIAETDLKSWFNRLNEIRENGEELSWNEAIMIGQTIIDVVDTGGGLPNIAPNQNMIDWLRKGLEGFTIEEGTIVLPVETNVPLAHTFMVGMQELLSSGPLSPVTKLMEKLKSKTPSGLAVSLEGHTVE